MRASILLCGAAIWGLGEVLHIVGGGHSRVVTVAMGMGLIMSGIGMTALWTELSQNRYVRTGIVAYSAGLLVQSYVFFTHSLTGVMDLGVLTQHWGFVLACVLSTAGAICLSIGLYQQNIPKWISFGLPVMTMCCVVVAFFIPILVPVLPVFSLLLAFVQAELALTVSFRQSAGNAS